MKKIYIAVILCLTGIAAQAQVTQVYTDFNNFYTTSSTNINLVKPNLSHNLLAFRFNGTVYSTGVNNAKLTANGVTFTSTNYRALPIINVPVTSAATSYYIGKGALSDGIQNGVTATGINPHATTSALKSAYLTDGLNGLDLGTCLTNIPSTNLCEFSLSAQPITASQVNDGIPDILVSQIAQPENNSYDELYFVNASGVKVGNSVIINMSNNVTHPIVGNWNPDFYNNNSTQTDNVFVNSERPYRFFSAELSAFGVSPANYATVKKLVYKPSGNSDPAFIAFNEPSMGVASQITIASQPTTSNCNGTMPSAFSIQLTDGNNNAVPQAGYTITASMNTGPGMLTGTVTAITNASGIATFSGITFEVGADHTIRFESSSFKPAVSATISGPVCDPNTWTGNTSTDWNNTSNWLTAVIPNANSQVTIPAGRPNYPVLTANAGAGNLIMGNGSSININGRQFTIKGAITAATTAKINAGSSFASELYMSGNTPQVIPSGLFLNNAVANFTVENPQGVTTNSQMNVSDIVRVRSGNFETNGNLALICQFSPHKTGQIGILEGTISGNVSTEQCYPARRAFRFVTSSVTTTTNIRANWQENAASYIDNPHPGYGTHITGAGASSAATDGVNGFDWQPSGAASMFTFSNATQAWGPILNTNVTTLTAGTPYRLMIRGSRAVDITSNAATTSDTKLRATGTIVKGPVVVTGLSSVVGAYNLVGNPFHSLVDLASVFGNSLNVRNFVYVWDPKMGGANPVVGQPGGRGSFVTYNTATGLNNVSGSAVNRYLQPNQSIFVISTGGTPSLTFRESDKAPAGSHTNTFRTGGRPFVSINLYTQEALAEESTPSDGLRIDFNESGNNDVDDNDAPKFSNPDESMSRLVGETAISMEERMLPEAGEELPVTITQYRKTNYTLDVSLGNFEGMDIYLKDNFLNTETPLANGETTAVNFTVNSEDAASINSERFAVKFVTAALGVETVLNKDTFSIYPNPATGNVLYVNASGKYANAQVAVYNTIGQQVYASNATVNGSNQIIVPVGSLNAGIYIIKLKTDTGAAFSAKFIKQ